MVANMNRAPRRVGQGRQTVSVFVGHLHKNATQQMLQELFQDCGEIKAVFVQRNIASGDFIYGFVRFYEMAAAEKAVATLNGWPVLGLDIRVELSDQTKSGENRPVPVPGLKATNEDYANLSKLMFALAEAARMSEESGSKDILNPDDLLKQISEIGPSLVPVIRHPARRTLNLEDLDAIVSSGT